MKPVRKISATVSSVTLNQQIDVVELLGRPARKVTFVNSTTPSSTECELRVNTLTKVNVEEVEQVDTTIDFWPSSGSAVATAAPTALLEENVDVWVGEGGLLPGIPISSVEVIGLTTSETGDLIFI